MRERGGRIAISRGTAVESRPEAPFYPSRTSVCALLISQLAGSSQRLDEQLMQRPANPSKTRAGTDSSSSSSSSSDCVFNQLCGRTTCSCRLSRDSRSRPGPASCRQRSRESGRVVRITTALRPDGAFEGEGAKKGRRTRAGKLHAMSVCGNQEGTATATDALSHQRMLDGSQFTPAVVSPSPRPRFRPTAGSRARTHAQINCPVD